MTTVLDRWETERIFHDEQAAERAASFASGRADLEFADAEYLDHESWIRPAFANLGNLRGCRALDYGCGHGMAAVVLARAGATVTAFDLSPGYVCEAELRAQANRVHIQFEVANGENLPFPDASFDAVWGSAILHHLDLSRAGAELARVLAPGGVAVFCEPWGGNPILEFTRKHLPYPGKSRTPDERPIRIADLEPLKSFFPELQFQGFQLFSMLRRAWPNRTIVGMAERVDRRLLQLSPSLGYWCRYAVLTLRKREPSR